MYRRRRLLILSVLPLALFGGMLHLNWTRSHPAPTPLDQALRTLLASCDTVKVEIETKEFVSAEGLAMMTVSKPVERLTLADTAPVASYLNLSEEQPALEDSDFSPAIDFVFCKGSKEQAAFCVDHTDFRNSYLSCPHSYFFKRLHPTTVRRLWKLMSQHPKILQALIDAGVARDDLNRCVASYTSQ